MTKKQLKSLFIPDTPKEWSAIGSSFARLGAAMASVTLFAADKWWTLSALFLGWLGHEVSQYFKLYYQDEEKKQE